MQKKIKVMVIDDDPEFNNVLSHELEKTGFDIQSRLSGIGLIEHLNENPCHVILLDIQMPGKDGNVLLEEIKDSFQNIQVIMLTGFGTIDSAVKSVRQGAFDYLTKPCDLGTIETTIHRAYKMLTLEQQNLILKHSLAKQSVLTEMVGDSVKIREVRDFISRVAPTNSSVLLLGESGVGKEVAARAIHQSSNRKEQPFLVVDCGALDENLLSSELFGHEKGALTGAFRKKPGLLEIAQGGTIFLDEIGEISSAIQVKLLRFLETGQIRSLGGNRDITIDARIIASTNRDFRREMEAGNFREDLFYRLNVIVSTLPPLRERIDDIPFLTEHFLRFMRDAGWKTKTISPAAMEYLCEYR